jgi:Zn-dependent protease with chaperone function
MRFRQHQQAATQTTLRLLLLFGAVLIGLVLSINAVLALIYRITFPFAHGFPAYFFETNTALVLLFVLGGCWVETLRLREGGVHVARLAGGRQAQVSGGGELAALERRFANIVHEMAIASGHTGGREGVPAAWVLPKDDAINAFAAGWGGEDAVVAVTRGALERLTRAELQGVVAHEFSHLVHGDTRLNMRLVGLVWGLQMVWGLGCSLWAPNEDGRRGPGALFGLGLMAVGSLGWAAGRLLQAAVSRQREFLADASAVKYTRVVDGLGGALRKIADQQARHVAALHSGHAASLAHLLLAHRSAAAGWRALWHTHPPLSERLRRLYGREVLPLAAEMLPPIDEGDDDAPMRIAPALPGGAAPAADVRPAGATTQVIPEAHRHDALQVPTSFDAAAREAEALARIERWHGPGEWQAAMLALALEPHAPGAASRWAAWREATADLGVAAAVGREVEVLGAPARRRVFELLLQRARAAPLAQRRQARRALFQRWRACPRSPGMDWRALALGLLLDSRLPIGRRTASSLPLARQAEAADAATRLLATALGAADDAGHAWRRAAALSLAEAGAAAPRNTAVGLAPATSRRQLMLALRVRRIAPMQRPLLVRAWLQAAEHSGLAGHPGTADALHLACLALDVPVPEALRVNF